MVPNYSSLVLVLLFLCNISLSKALKGFSVEMIHRDSEKSPFYIPSETHSQRVAKAIQRSIARANHLTKPFLALDTVESPVIPNSGEYLMTYSVGTPPFKIFSIVDTGSNIVWFQCQPCINCYKETHPIFDSSQSNTYKTLPCSSRACTSLSTASCSEDGNKCTYTIQYGDGSHSSGDLSVETLTLPSTEGSSVSFPNMVIGCGNDNSGTFQANGSGIVGLSAGSTSLISQLSSTIEGKFSYCLSGTSPSKLSFGDAAVVSGSGTVSTPIIQQQNQIFYFLTLDSLNVGDSVVPFGAASSSSSSSETGAEGNIIIDSGTTLTLLPDNVYQKLESTVAEQVKLNPAKDPQGFLGLCYESSSSDTDVFSGIPVITAHFRGGADLRLNPVNTLSNI
uniref:Peptidase A1 domain-containing protein n=1 Tax=Phaseolus vulgaris TaxID=3885 RepID=V7AKL4_PHAVU|nr:hypothetical protein PHAVU_011G209900g [Phaseolus vulgaris]ESW05790.1 hypothetical protein PHAVU_011G209900g [Phaseolus vulgaris]